MPKTKEQYEEIRHKSKKIIVETALDLFVTNGYHATSISQIAKKAGIAIGLMYNYFKSKEELLIYIMEEELRYISNIAVNESRKSKAFDIRILIDSIFKAITQKSGSWLLIISVMFQPDVGEGVKQLMEGFEMHQQQLGETYFTSIGLPKPVESAKTLVAVLHGALLSFALSGNQEEFALIRNNVIEKLITEGVQ